MKLVKIKVNKRPEAPQEVEAVVSLTEDEIQLIREVWCVVKTISKIIKFIKKMLRRTV